MTTNNSQKSMLTEEDLAGTVLADLKRVVREYATAATESNCPTVRQMFTDLLNKTLTMQGQLYTVMSQVNMYQAPSVAPKKELDKQLRSYSSQQQQTQSWLQQNNLDNQHQTAPLYTSLH
ncbi:spore coat protein [Paenibacillus endoradicis]|uniref:spore coat protein n=1 Tax=Paenibacillus endoradicis TaxID=2972487 RepID=UPI002159058E|nr:spore coat protein [Paenibacillus endoradicis]MCR8657931.1 spore coat protein [Paenibacillus endoradicis]